jgi:ribosomal protein S19E (S16A)
MKRSVIIPLSRQEEDMLRLIAHGACPARHLRQDDLDQLTRLGLVEHHDQTVMLSAFGRARLAQIEELAFQSMIQAARLRQPAVRAA